MRDSCMMIIPLYALWSAFTHTQIIALAEIKSYSVNKSENFFNQIIVHDAYVCVRCFYGYGYVCE